LSNKAKKYLLFAILGAILLIYLVYPNFLNPVLNPLLKLPRLLTLLLVSLVITIVMTLVYKWTTDQAMMKALKEDQKKYQKQIKEHKNDPKKMMELNKKAMEANMQYFKSSMKSTLITFIPLLIIFTWMSSNLAYNAILPEQEFNVTASVTKGFGELTLAVPSSVILLSNATQPIADRVVWTMKAEKGDHLLNLTYGNKTYSFNVLVDDLKYSIPVKKLDKSLTISVSYGKWKAFGEKFNLFGWYPGWLFTYIVSSLIFSTILRKILKVY